MTVVTSSGFSASHAIAATHSMGCMKHYTSYTAIILRAAIIAMSADTSNYMIAILLLRN